ACAMPRPIWPAPTTPTLRISMGPSSYDISSGAVNRHGLATSPGPDVRYGRAARRRRRARQPVDRGSVAWGTARAARDPREPRVALDRHQLGARRRRLRARRVGAESSDRRPCPRRHRWASARLRHPHARGGAPEPLPEPPVERRRRQLGVCLPGVERPLPVPRLPPAASREDRHGGGPGPEPRRALSRHAREPPAEDLARPHRADGMEAGPRDVPPRPRAVTGPCTAARLHGRPQLPGRHDHERGAAPRAGGARRRLRHGRLPARAPPRLVARRLRVCERLPSRRQAADASRIAALLLLAIASGYDSSSRLTLRAPRPPGSVRGFVHK